MPTVKTFNNKEIKNLIKETNPKLREYILAQNRALKGQQETTALAIKKLKALGKPEIIVEQKDFEKCVWGLTNVLLKYNLSEEDSAKIGLIVGQVIEDAKIKGE